MTRVVISNGPAASIQRPPSWTLQNNGSPYITGSTTPFVKLAFEVDGQQQLDQEIRLAIEIDGKTFEPKIVKGGFIVPAEVQNGKQIDLMVHLGQT